MLSNSKDLYDGKLPYKEIFIQYGYLTTLVHAAGYALSKSLLTLISSTTIAYILGLIILFELSVKAIKSELIALYVVIIAYLFHPLVIYPWSNYVAYPFLMYGVFILVYPQSRILNFLGGVCLGLSILAREGLAPAVSLAIFISFAIDFFNRRDTLKQYILRLINIILGFLFPIIIFFIYIVFFDLFEFWKIMSIDLPKVYAKEIFVHMSGVKIFRGLKDACINGITSLDFRWILISIMYFANLYILFRYFLKDRPKYLSVETLKISFFCLLFSSSALHSPEIFRISTASIIGLISLFIVLNFYNLAYKVFILFAVSLTITIIWKNSGIYYFPSLQNIQMGNKVEISEYFSGQRWNAAKIDYYKKVDSEFRKVNALKSCKINYFVNNTNDAFITLLSPFKPLQQAPFVLRQYMSNLRADYVLLQKRKIGEAVDVLVVEGQDPKDPESHNLNFDNYRLIAVISNPEKRELKFYLPLGCFPN
jgi:hypothetical protein